MEQWKVRFKKLLQLQKETNSNQNNQSSQKQNRQKEQQKKQDSFLPFSFTSFLTKSHQQSNQKQNSNIKRNLEITQKQQINNFPVQISTNNQLQPSVNDELPLQQIKDQINSQTQKVIMNQSETQKVNMNQLYKFLQQKVGEQLSTQNQEDYQTRSDSQDSLGYTQNDWDEQTINFQLQDRMLDCLQDQKHANQYRQSLAQSSFMRKQNQQRFSKPVRPPSPQENDLNQLDFQKIIQQQNLPHQFIGRQNVQKIIEEKKISTKRERKNRFSKYKKHGENNFNKQKLFFNNQEQQMLEKVLKQKIQQLQAQGDQNCDDYIARVFKIKTYEQLKRLKKQQGETSVQIIKNIGVETQLNKTNEINKKVSIISQGSFQVIEQIKHINQLQLHNKQSTENSHEKDQKLNSNQFVLFNKDNQPCQIQNLKTQTIPHSQKQQRQKEEKQSEKQNLIYQMKNIQKQINSETKEIKINSEKQEYQKPSNLNLFQIQNQSPSKINKVRPFPLRQNINKNIQNNIKNQNKLLPTTQSFNEPKIQKDPQISFKQILSDKQLPIIYSPMKKKQKIVQSPFKNLNFLSPNQQNLNNLKIKPYPQVKFQIKKSPQTKIKFNYINTHQKTESIPIIKHQLQPQNLKLQIILNNSKSKQNKSDYKSNLLSKNLEAQSQERIPIFLQRLRRLISIYPNFQSSTTDLSKIHNDLKIILNAMKSAISVIELLFKKMKIQRNRLQELFIKAKKSVSLPQNLEIQKNKLESQIWDLFINSGWENYKIEEIEFIKPKQNFKRRTLNPVKVQEALHMYNQFINFYLNQPILMMKTSDEIQRYIRIRQKISQIVQYLRMISQDLYTYWLQDCHLPYLYYEFLDFLKQTNPQNLNNTRKDQIYAKLIQAQDHKDPLSLSIIGEKINQKVSQSTN